MRHLRDLAVVVLIAAVAAGVWAAQQRWQAQRARDAITALYAQMDAQAMNNDTTLARGTLAADFSSRWNGRAFSRGQQLYMTDLRARQVAEYDIRPLRFQSVIKHLDVPSADCVIADVESTDEISTRSQHCFSLARHVALNASEKRDTWILRADGWKRVYTEGTTVRRTFDGKPVDPTEWMKDIP